MKAGGALGSTMGKILWLASYPRSGNTWLRAFLHNYLRNSAQPHDINRLRELTTLDSDARWYRMFDPRPCESLTKEEAAALRPKVHQAITQSRPDTVFVKTHSALVVDRGTPTITSDCTAGAVYIVRNPLDVAVSYSVHYGVSLDEAVAAMNRPHNQSTANQPNFVYEFFGSWSENVESWTERETKGIHVIRYEDMREASDKTFGGVIEFLGLPVNPARLRRAIENSAFPILQAQEKQAGFRERSLKSENFFRAGRSGEGRERLDAAQIQSLCQAHEVQMRRFGYWPSADATS
ncbi:MAG TPA: sulfotransferase domain-containing protein [Dongiaceae bacterium]